MTLSRLILFLLALVGIGMLCCCLATLALSPISMADEFIELISKDDSDKPGSDLGATQVPLVSTPTIIRSIPHEEARQTLVSLESAIIPSADPFLLACVLKGICSLNGSSDLRVENLQPGSKSQFWILHSDDNNYSRITANLEYASPHAYFWVQEGVRFNLADAMELVDTFEEQIYPTTRDFFGSEWFPGVDGDEHIHIIYARNLGTMVAGLYSTGDEYPPEISNYSNMHEAFYINSTEDLAADYTYGILAHEFQHMIHWNQDHDEGSFLDEGFSELATFVNGYETGKFDSVYVSEPDMHLTGWAGDAGDNGAHYGASFLFVTYFLDRFGEEAAKALIRDPMNSLESVDHVLSKLGIKDGQTGILVTADNFFQDWTISNYLQDASLADGRFGYHNYPLAPKAYDTEQFYNCPFSSQSRTVNQYGVDYIRFNCQDDFTISFRGSTLTSLLPVGPHSGAYAFWSNRSDKADMTLTREFDLTDVQHPITMEYWTWFDLEADYDYAYVEASRDGTHWEILNTPSGSEFNPAGNSYGWAYNGFSRGWINESVDLSDFSGEKVWLRFQYITDTSVTSDGLLIDDISIPAIAYFEGFEGDEGGWIPNGFVRIQNELPQTFQLGLITLDHNLPRVQYINLEEDQSAEISVDINANSNTEVVLVVSALNRFTRIQTRYEFNTR